MKSFPSFRFFIRKCFLVLAFASLAGFVVMACGKDEGGENAAADNGGGGGGNGGGGIITGDAPRFSAAPASIGFSQLSVGENDVRSVWVENTGTGSLRLTNIELINEVGDSLSKSGDWPDEVTLEEHEEHEFQVKYEPTDEQEHAGLIRMSTNDPNTDPAEIEIETAGFGAEIFVNPSHVDFPQTPPGYREWEPVEIRNIGAGTLELGDIFVTSGDEHFEIAFMSGGFEDGSYPPVEEDSDTPPMTHLESDEDRVYMRVWFEPDDEDPKEGSVLIENNAGDYTLDLSGNSGEPCLEVVGDGEIAFGPSAIDNTTHHTATLRNCSPQADLELEGVSISEDAGGVFSIQEGGEPGTLPDETYILTPGDVTTTVIAYSPIDEAEDEGELLIESNDTRNPNLRIPITGNGVDAECPVAVAAGSVGGAAAPDTTVIATNQDVVHLTSAGSEDPDGTDLSYEWSVITRPDGSMSEIQPSPFEPEPQFEVDIVGDFKIELTVYDETGLRNCEPAIVDILAAPTEDIHIQLTWSAPEVDSTYGGPNSDMGIGTDLDVHYLSPAVNDNWGSSDTIYYWYPEQDWGEYGYAVLDIDDLYGENPENINHTDPALGERYRLGVHYFDDKNHGPADARVRVYFDDYLHDQYEKRLNGTGDFWYLGNIEWAETPYVDFQDVLTPNHSLPSASP